MTIRTKTLTYSEKVVYTLRAIYEASGYQPYRMSKFEEYDLYARNKDFLVSDSVITFTDADGKLLALKPDVTLSLIKNVKDAPDALNRLYYDENVYRLAKGSGQFKEILQTGLECIGAVDDYTSYEVLRLAAESLLAVSKDVFLDVSHLGLVSEILEDAGLSGDDAARALAFIGEKNAHELAALLDARGLKEEKAASIVSLISVYGAPKAVLPKVKKLCASESAAKAFAELEKVLAPFRSSPLESVLHVDFSVVSDTAYYNGVVFKGFVKGVPEPVLSGGRYDKLMARMGKKSGAIGFAVYLDALERFGEKARSRDVDAVILYNASTARAVIEERRTALQKSGKSVCVSRTLPEKLTYGEVIDLRKGRRS